MRGGIPIFFGTTPEPKLLCIFEQAHVLIYVFNTFIIEGDIGQNYRFVYDAFDEAALLLRRHVLFYFGDLHAVLHSSFLQLGAVFESL